MLDVYVILTNVISGETPEPAEFRVYSPFSLKLKNRNCGFRNTNMVIMGKCHKDSNIIDCDLMCDRNHCILIPRNC